MLLLHPQQFNDYDLIDCGDFLKMERFGKYITIRPEPQAVWSPANSITEWRGKAHVEFIPKSSSAMFHLVKTGIPDKYQFTHQEVLHAAGSEKQIVEAIGSAGTLVIFDTNCIHRGKPIESGTRYAITNYYI